MSHEKNPAPPDNEPTEVHPRRPENAKSGLDFDGLLALGLEVPVAERGAWLATHCDDADLRRELAELFDREAELGDFLEPPVFSVEEDETWGSPRQKPASNAAAGSVPETIGPYRIVEVLGEGGMGVVYLAEQNEPVERRLAVKVVRADLTALGVSERFLAERQALARLSHPFIAQMYEAGATEQGFPYFAMELVGGEPITKYCDHRRLPIEERLSLFVKVCEGVQHAHQRGILHRDLKPSNILVSEVDGRPVPKLIDFGIAKALDRPLTAVTQLTSHGAVGTPAYMSPESLGLDGDQVDVDTRTDVYALGMVLYELLAGVRPFDLTGVSAAQVVQRLLSEEVPRPSVRVARLDDEKREEVASARGLDEHALPRFLAADLDWIVDKAIRRKRDERYDSAAGLAADLGRYLSNQPVEARPPSRAYLAKKFVKRHTGAVAAAAAGLLLLIAFAVTMTVQAGRIAAERDRANREAEAKGQVSDFLKDLFTVSDPSEARGNSITAREILDQGVEKIEGTLEDQPEVRAGLMDTMGTVYQQLGLYDAAEPLLEQALGLRKQVLGDDHPDSLASTSRLGSLYRIKGRFSEAETLLLTALARQRRILGDDHEDTLSTLSELAVVYQSQGHYEKAESLLLEALDGYTRRFGDEHPLTLTLAGRLEWLYYFQGRYAEAEQLSFEDIEKKRRILGSDHPETLRSMHALAVTYSRTGRYEAAERLFQEVIDVEQRVFGEDHAATLVTLANLVGLYYEEGRYEEAVRLNLEIIARRTRKLGADHHQTLSSKYNLTVVYRDQGRLDEAKSLLGEVLAAQRRVLGEDHPETLKSIRIMAGIYQKQSRSAEAEQWYRQAFEAFRRTLGEEDPRTLASMNNLGELLLSVSRVSEAEDLHRRVLALRKRVLGPNHMYTLLSECNLARALLAQGKLDEAHRLAKGLLDQLEEVKIDSHTADAIVGLAGDLEAAGLETEAGELRQAAERRGGAAERDS